MAILTFYLAGVCVPAFGQGTQAQSVPPEPVATTLTWFYQDSRKNFVGAAELMPADKYGYRPSPDVRTFGEIVGHIANWQFTNCAAARGEANPNGKNYEVTPSKDAALAGLKAAYAYCDDVFTGLDLERLAAAGTRPPPMFRAMSAIAHPYLHYGNLVTYLRLNGIVPPSSAGR